MFGEFVRTQACPRCGGTGRVVEHPCSDCGGAGRVVEERTLEVEIPPGIHDGQRIRISGEGHAGALGGRAGDVYVAGARPARPAFRARGQRHLLDGRPDDHAGRARRDASRVPTLDGDAELEFEPGTQPGEVRVLRGRGMPVLQGFGRGDQRVLVNVLCPAASPTSSGACSRSSSASSATSTYGDDEGFFEKLKSAFR